ncbi:DeoR/GlpR family DNA-binding transcription regulator [Streptomyces sp. NPDC051315]|uniref:DeoR/GlpR family DNA-binding transcription regulator n=1 Tax=Streptomyces sp. NPDC051315 TaxID=3365650 RepID=UPI003798EA0A
MLAERRQQRILSALRSGGPASVTDLSEQLGGVSPATVRRDLVRLEEGPLTRIHGGAVEEGDQPFAEVTEVRVPEKDAMAAHAAAMIADGQSALLDVGTTRPAPPVRPGHGGRAGPHRLARRLHGRRLTAITGNLVVHEDVAGDGSIDRVPLGGMARRENRSLIGFLTEDTPRRLHADWLFLGTSAVRPGGQVPDTTVAEVPVERAMIKASDKVVLPADRARFPGTDRVRVWGPEDLGVVVTDAPVYAATRARPEEAGVDVVLAGEVQA